jgi:hypothetical protein
MKSKLLLRTKVLALLCFSNIIFGQVPDLGINSGFAVFTAIGAFGNLEATTITGNIGTNAGALTGFPPGVVVGQIYVADSVSLQASTDVTIAYDYLDAVTCDSVIGTTLGNNQVLAPKVYCMGAASTLNGNLILDGQGNSNAVFVFKINGAFSTTSLSTITLIDSALWSNIYWQINGAVSLEDGSVFVGTILANGAISLLESASLFGRALSIVGAISLQNNIVTIGTQTSSPLPIEMLSFTAHVVDANVQIYWSTATEINNNFFTIERSRDGIYFDDVLQVQGAKNSNTVLYYSAVDDEPYNGTSYYRLKQTDFNGKFSYEKMVTINFEKIIDCAIYPNPFVTSITIKINSESKNANCILSIYNAFGIEVMNAGINKQLNVFDTGNLSSGIYFYKILNDDNQVMQSGKLLSQQ